MAQSPSQPPPPLLTPRQLEVLELMARGLVNREIARVLGIAPATVKRHVSSVIEALDVTNRTEAATALHELGLGARRAATGRGDAVPGFGERPAIAVMPFDNLSHEPEHAYLADAIVEDLITRLASWRWFPVIARSSTYTYQGRSVDAREVSRGLGAPFLVTGSVRPVAGAVRITVQLIDGESGEQFWASRYDRELARVFELENEIVDTIVASLAPGLARIQGLRALPKPPEHLGAWELLSRGFVLATRDPEAIREVGELFERAAALDPNLALAQVGLANVEILALTQQRGGDPGEVEARAIRLAEQAVALDGNEPMAHMILGWARLYAREPAEALAAFERAIELNPSLAWAHLGRGPALWAQDLGRAEEGVEAVRRAIRLSPQDPFLHWVMVFRGLGEIAMGRLDDAQRSFDDARRLAPGEAHAYPLLAACLVLRSEPDAARAQLARMRELNPRYSPLAHARRFSPVGHVDNYAAVLAAAGWKE